MNENQNQRGEMIALAQAVAMSADTETQRITIQVLRAGAFVDMHGSDVLVENDDLLIYIANSNAALERAQIPVELGHPYDAGAPAAAWYTNFFEQVVNGVEWVCAEIELSALGAQALADKLYKYFSANLDLAAKVVTGGGFVNRPAVTGQQTIGSLSAYLSPRRAVTQSVTKGGDTNMTEEQMQAQLAAAVEAARSEERAALVKQQAEFDAALAAAREDERARVLAEQKRANEIRELANTLTAGPRALWHKPAELEAWLGKLTDDDRALVGDLLKEIQTKGLVDLGERGTQQGGAALAQLPKYAAAALAQWIEAKNEINDFFAVNHELGKADQYDLSAYVPAK